MVVTCGQTADARGFADNFVHSVLICVVLIFDNFEQL
jgi:hypothetical protein